MFNRCCKGHDDCYGDIQWTIGGLCDVYRTSFSYDMNLQTESISCCKCPLNVLDFMKINLFCVPLCLTGFLGRPRIQWNYILCITMTVILDCHLIKNGFGSRRPRMSQINFVFKLLSRLWKEYFQNLFILLVSLALSRPT